MKFARKIIAVMVLMSMFSSTVFAAEIYEKKYVDIVNVTEYYDESGFYTEQGDFIEAFIGQDYLDIVIARDVDWVDLYFYKDEEFYPVGIDVDDDLIKVDFDIVMVETGEIISSYKYHKLLESGQISKDDECYIRAGSVLTVYGVEDGEKSFGCNVIYNDGESSYFFIGIVYDYGEQETEQEIEESDDEITQESDETTTEILTGTAKATTATVNVDGEQITFEAYEINGNNYFKLRDIAAVASGSAKQFEVFWDETSEVIELASDSPYTVVGGELETGDGEDKEYISTTSEIYKDGEITNFTAFEINDNNYFKLRDICQAFDIGVNWDDATQTIDILTDTGYVE